MMEEPALQSQTKALGEVMRSLSGFTLPGIDMLCDAREYTTAKQAQSICHQYGVQSSPPSNSNIPMSVIFQEGSQIILMDTEIVLVPGFLYLIDFIFLATPN